MTTSTSTTSCAVPSPDPVVSNTTPIIKLAGVAMVHLLPALYRAISIPEAVYHEYQAGRASRLGSPDLDTLSWLTVHPVAPDPAVPATLDAGEAEAIALARPLNARILLLDERRGRRAAVRLGLPVVGTLALLLRAKQQGLLPLVRPVLDQMVAQGRYIGADLYEQIVRAAGEWAP
jgi:predicted nucleic acid-binding protein